MDFSQLVNIGNTESGLSADQDNLKVSTDAASGDVVLTAVADEINTPDPTASWLGNNKDGHNTIKAGNNSRRRSENYVKKPDCSYSGGF
ncbi:MAG: hypothetical protein LKE29_02690 [Acidaminococcaceae bacterium]|nr:hypothetical protein [Acidaminococcaceae bacterium]